MFGTILSNLRKEKKLLQKDVANYLKVSTSSYGFYEQGKRDPDYETLTKIADFFNVSIDYLLGRTDFKNQMDYSFTFFEDYFSQQNIKKILLNKSKDTQNSIYQVLVRCLQFPLTFAYGNLSEEIQGRDIDWLFLICKMNDIILNFYLNQKAIFIDPNATSYHDLEDFDYLSYDADSLMNPSTPISTHLLEKMNKNKELTKLSLNLVLQQFEKLSLYGNTKDSLFEGEFLKYAKINISEKNEFAEFIKNDIANFLDYSLETKKNTKDSNF